MHGYNWPIDYLFVGQSEMNLLEFTLRHNVQHHLGQSEDKIFCVSLVMCTCNVWHNALSHICRSIGSNFKHYVHWSIGCDKALVYFLNQCGCVLFKGCHQGNINRHGLQTAVPQGRCDRLCVFPQVRTQRVGWSIVYTAPHVQHHQESQEHTGRLQGTNCG